MATSEKPAAAAHYRRDRIKSLLAVFGLAFLGFVPIMGFLFFNPAIIWRFPIGVMLLFLTLADQAYVDGGNELIGLILIVLWLGLLGISIAIVTSASKRRAQWLFGALIVFLALNLVGWYAYFFSHIT